MNEVIVLGFDSESQADRVLPTVTQMVETGRLIDLGDSAVVVRDRDGKVQFEPIKQDLCKPKYYLRAAIAVGGSLIGLLVGAIVQHPLLGAVIGTATGTILGVLAKADKPLSCDAPFIRELGRLVLRPQTSALFVLVPKAQPDRVLEQLSQFEGRVLLTSLSKEDEKKLMDENI